MSAPQTIMPGGGEWPIAILLVAHLMLWSPLTGGHAQGASESPSLTLADALDQALGNHPLVRAAASGVDHAEASVEEARAGRFPRLRFREQYTHSNNPVFVFGTLLEQARFGPGNFALDALNHPGSISNFRSALELGLPVFDRFERRHQVREGQSGTLQAQARLSMVEQHLRFRVIEAYFSVVLAQSTVRVAQDAVGTAEAQQKRIADHFAEGMVVESDLLAIQVELASLESRAAAARGTLDSAWAALNTLLGRDLESRSGLETPLAPRPFPLPEAAAVAAEATRNRQDRIILAEQVDIQRERLRRVRNQVLPDLSLFAEFGHSAPDWIDGSADYAVGARLSLDILDFGRGPRARAAQAALEQAEWELRERDDAIRLECVRAMHDFDAALEGLAALEKAGDRAREARRIVENRHEAGLTDITELLRAQSAVVRAEGELLSGLFNAHVGYARVLLAGGLLRDGSAFR